MAKNDDLLRFVNEKPRNKSANIFVRLHDYPDLHEFMIKRLSTLACSGEAYIRALIRRDMEQNK